MGKKYFWGICGKFRPKTGFLVAVVQALNKPTDSGKLNPRFGLLQAAQTLLTVLLLPAVFQLLAALPELPCPCASATYRPGSWCFACVSLLFIPFASSHSHFSTQSTR
jgi:hypothetical protein